MTTWTIRIVGILIALLVATFWRGIERDTGSGGALSGAIRGALFVLFVAWLWSVTRAKSTPEQELARPSSAKVSEVSPQPPLAPYDATSPSVKSEEELFEEANIELNSPERRNGLWGKAFAQADGHEARAQATYLKLRVEQLMSAQQARVREFEAKREVDQLHERRKSLGICPSCDKEVSRTIKSCPYCRASFGPGYELRPLP